MAKGKTVTRNKRANELKKQSQASSPAASTARLHDRPDTRQNDIPSTAVDRSTGSSTKRSTAPAALGDIDWRRYANISPHIMDQIMRSAPQMAHNSLKDQLEAVRIKFDPVEKESKQAVRPANLAFWLLITGGLFIVALALFLLYVVLGQL